MNDPTAAEAKRRPSPYLPVLPDGWEYEVAIRGPKGASVTIEEKTGLADGVADTLMVVTVTSDGQRRSAAADDLATALRKAADGAKALHAVEEQEQAAREARKAALAALGDPERAEPVAAEG